MKRRTLLIGLLFEATFFAQAQTWTEPSVPGEDLNSLKSTEAIYFYNVEADAFVLNGMTSNSQACATRLTNGDYAATTPNRFNIYVTNGKVQVKQTDHNKAFISCVSETANDVLIKSGTDTNSEFVYAEISEGSHVYRLNNAALGKDLDISWSKGGHLTLTDGAGKYLWAFIKESSITDGSYALYKSKKQLYAIYQALETAGATAAHEEALADALEAYTDNKATVESITTAARTLFKEVHADMVTPLNVSFLLDDADMVSIASCDKWISSSPAFGWGEFEIYHKAFTLEQETSLPLGIYNVGFNVLYREDGSGPAPILTVTAEGKKYTGKAPLMGLIDYKVKDKNNNNWTQGSTYFQPNGMQSCGQALMHNDAMAWVNDIEIKTNGIVNINFTASSNNQWINWTGFELIYNGVQKESLLNSLISALEEAKSYYGEGTGIGAEELKVSIEMALGVSNDETATKQMIKKAINELQLATKNYRYNNASADSPIDFTSLIVNPSFEKDREGWEFDGMGTQSNNAFSIKKGNVYIEKWTSKGGKVGNGSVKQTIEGLDLGIYQLKVAAQNIQEDTPNSSQSGAYIVANDSQLEVDIRKDYTLTFTSIESKAVIGFLAKNATGNWIAADNFRLYYVGGNDEDYKAEMKRYIDRAQELVAKKMHTENQQTLTAAITAAETEYNSGSVSRFIKVSTPLRKAADEAEVSIEAFAALQAAINKAETQYGKGEAPGAEEYLAAITAAKAVYENGTSTFDQLSEQISLLDAAEFSYMLNSPSGIIPTITKTDKRYARGSVMAFGRFNYSLNGAKLKEAGFCYSTEKNPTVEDNRSTRYFDNYGNIYIMEDLLPSTVYYARPYVVTTGYQVAYGDELKIVTLPKGGMTWSYNNGGSAEENERINNAIEYGMYVWNMLMSTQGFHLAGNYGAGTPTADCSYGGWMRIGPNAAYQRTGTIMHEAAHGVGVGTHWTWGTLLVNGTWTGPRANSVLQFWNNNTTEEMHGDGMHMWPYGINGAHEDAGTDLLYYGNALIIQAMHEDGLQPTNGCFANAAYTFEHEDSIKYYIKNESEACGLNTSYLTVESSKLVWKAATSQDFAANDNFAWYLTFDPKVQNYTFRHAATNECISYSSSTLKTVSRETPSSSEKFQLIMGRKAITVGGGTTAMTVRGYWITKPNGDWARAIEANSDGSVKVSDFDLSAEATTQHWIIMTIEDVKKFDGAAVLTAHNELKTLVENIENLYATPHIEDAEGTDVAIENALLTAKALLDMNSSDLGELSTATENLRKEGMTFLSNATPSNIAQPFDITFMMSDPSITTGEGWIGSHNVQHSLIEYYEKSFDFYQTINNLPKGTYKLKVQAFTRPGSYESTYADYQAGRNNSNAFLYFSTKSQKIAHLAEYASASRVHSDDKIVSSPTAYIPNTMASAAAYFAKGYYDNELVVTLNRAINVNIGIRQGSAPTSYWTIFDNFRLYYYGSYTSTDVTGIEDIPYTPAEPLFANPADIYSINGVLVRKNATSLEGVEKGLYIINHKKVVVK